MTWASEPQQCHCPIGGVVYYMNTLFFWLYIPEILLAVTIRASCFMYVLKCYICLTNDDLKSCGFYRIERTMKCHMKRC